MLSRIRFLQLTVAGPSMVTGNMIFVPKTAVLEYKTEDDSGSVITHPHNTVERLVRDQMLKLNMPCLATLTTVQVYRLHYYYRKTLCNGPDRLGQKV